jgi:glycerol-3-phosphate acyltransferase PlsY
VRFIVVAVANQGGQPTRIVMMPAVILMAYAIGSIPFALLIARWWGADDLRRVGSGNLGAANVLRVSGVMAGVLVALLDITKGALSVTLARHLTHQPAASAAAGLAAIVGHIFPVWLRFHGGKGVATAFGVFAVLSPIALAPTLTIFAVAVALTRYISLGSVLAALALPPIAYATGSPGPTIAAALAASALIVFRHRTNLARLRAGVERRLGVRETAGTGSRGASDS